MNRNKKSFGKRTAALFGAIFATSSLAFGVQAIAASNINAQLCPDFNIVVDGTYQTFYTSSGTEAHPIVYNGTTYLPLRAVGEIMGKNVDWNQSTLTVTLSGTRSASATNGTPDNTSSRKNISAQLRDDFTIVVDGSKRTFTDANGNAAHPILYNGSTYLPLRAIGEIMGKSVSWDGNSNTVTLSGGNLVTDADSFNNAPANKPSVPNTTTSQSTSIISLDDAKSKALSHAGLSATQVTFKDQKLDWEDGRQVYEIEFFTNGGSEFEYEIDAISGEIISYDVDHNSYGPNYNGWHNNVHRN